PRNDVTPTFRSILGDSIKIIERGALDSLTDSEIEGIKPAEGDQTYISLLKTGKSTKISKAKLIPLLQAELIELEKEVDVTIILCTGDFPSIKSAKPIFYPDRVLVNVIDAVLNKGKIGLVIPLSEQKESLLKKWSKSKCNFVTEVASPYEKSDFKQAAIHLKNQGVEAIVLDCMGYNESHKMDVVKASGLPTLLSRSLVARVA